MEGCYVGNNIAGRNNNNSNNQQANAGQGQEEDYREPRGWAKLQDESRSYHWENIFGSGGKEGEATKESRAKEERKSKAGGSRIEVAGNIEEVEGRARDEKERKGREVETGGRRKGRRDDKEKSAHISWRTEQPATEEEGEQLQDQELAQQIEQLIKVTDMELGDEPWNEDTDLMPRAPKVTY